MILLQLSNYLYDHLLRFKYNAPEMASKQGFGSARVKEQQARRVLDSAARQRRARKALESLEQAIYNGHIYKYPASMTMEISSSIVKIFFLVLRNS